jgi:tetratricopeptide (TPR) repeat protein
VFEVGLPAVCEEIGDCFRSNNLQRAEQLLWPALDQFSDMPQLWFYAGNIFFQTNRAALAALAFERCIKLDDNPLVLANLGAAYRRLNRHDEGMAAVKAALDRVPDYAPALVNYGAMWVNEGAPEQGIPPLEKAVAIGRETGSMEKGAEWNLALLYLEAGRFAEGFDLYARGYGSERLVRMYAYDDVPEPERFTVLAYNTARAATLADKPRPTLIVWGEQGIGDELMFGTCLNDLIYHVDVILECHPRLEHLHQNSTWARKLREMGRPVRIFPTRKEGKIGWPKEAGIRADFKCPIADLAGLTRRAPQDFIDAWERHGPTYSYRPEEAASYRERLVALADGRPIVGLATHGGVLSTARQYRTLRHPEIEYLVENTDAIFVSFDYDDMTPTVMYLHQKYGTRFVWFPSLVQHWDYDHTAALLAATDLNVLVCQSAAHLSAGIGAPTRVLGPKRAAWRERYLKEAGPNGWYWWPGKDVKLYLQETAGDWSVPLAQVVEDIKAIK